MMAIFADVLAPHSPVVGNLGGARLLPPGSPGYLLGTDDQGRDILSRLIYGSRLTLAVVVLVAVIAAGRLSAARPVQSVTIEEIGLLMGGTAGPQRETHAAPA